MTCDERNETMKNAPIHTSAQGPRGRRLTLSMLTVATALTAGCPEPRFIGDNDAGAPIDAPTTGEGDDAARPTAMGDDAGLGRDPGADAGARRRDAGPGGQADAGPATAVDSGPSIACRTDADCEASGGGVCDEGICVHIAECAATVERASCAERTSSARWCVGGRNKMAKLSRLLCTEEAVTARIYEVGPVCVAGACTDGRVCEGALTGTGRAFCGARCAGDGDCAAGDSCLSFSTGSYCGHPIGAVEDVFCSTTNVDGEFGPAFAAPRFFDASGAPIEIRGDLQEVLDLDPSAGCP